MHTIDICAHCAPNTSISYFRLYHLIANVPFFYIPFLVFWKTMKMNDLDRHTSELLKPIFTAVKCSFFTYVWLIKATFRLHNYRHIRVY